MILQFYPHEYFQQYQNNIPQFGLQVETRKKYDESTQVNLIHDVTFKKLQGNTNNVIPIGIDKETSFSKKLKVNSEIDPDELFKAAEEAFKTLQNLNKDTS